MLFNAPLPFFQAPQILTSLCESHWLSWHDWISMVEWYVFRLNSAWQWYSDQVIMIVIYFSWDNKCSLNYEYAHSNGTTLNELSTGHQSFIISIICICNLEFKVFICETFTVRNIITIHYLIKLFCSTHLCDFTMNWSKKKKKI